MLLGLTEIFLSSMQTVSYEESHEEIQEAWVNNKNESRQMKDLLLEIPAEYDEEILIQPVWYVIDKVV